MRQSEFYAAVYGIIENEKGEILCLQRANTGFMDGLYGLPAWHLEWEETLKQWVIREVQEEIWIEIQEEDVEILCNGHRVSLWERVYFDYYFRVKKYSWEPYNAESEKCSWLAFLAPDDENIIPYLREVFHKISQGEKFIEQYITL